MDVLPRFQRPPRQPQAVLDAALHRHRRHRAVLQEILHRYASIRRPDRIDLAFTALLAVVDVVYPIERPDVGSNR